MCRDLCPPNSDVKVVIDDGSYFPFSQETVPGNDCFFSTNKENTPPLVRYRQKKTYEPKVLVSLAVSEDGHSEPFFRTRGLSINGEVYREECIWGRLQPFLQEVHSDDEVLFWPHLASAHYARSALFGVFQTFVVLQVKIYNYFQAWNQNRQNYKLFLTFSNSANPDSASSRSLTAALCLAEFE